AGAGLVPARLDDDDLLGAGRGPGGAEELADVADRLHVEDDAARVGVVAEVVDEVGEVHVEHGAHADEAAEADVGFPGPVEDGGADGAALAEQGDLAGPGHPGGEAGVEAADGVDDAQAVGADDAHAAAGGVADLGFEGPAGGAEFGEAGGDDDGRLDA